MPQKMKDQRVSLAAIASAPGLLTAAGVSADGVALSAGLNPRDFDDTLRTVTFREMGRYLGACALATGDDAFSLRVGLASGPGALSNLGFMAMNTPNLSGALDTLARYVYQVGGEVAVSRERGLAMLSYSFQYPHIDGALFIGDAAMGLAIALLQAMCGPSWAPLEVRFSRPVPGAPGDWQRKVHAPVCFGAEQNFIVFSARWLDHSIERADPGLRRLLHDKIAALETQRNVDFPALVGAVIRSSLLAGDASLEHVAGRLTISTATLKRRLRAGGTGFSALLDQTRMEIACQLLGNSKATMVQIAEILGYGYSSAFSRSFQRWAGMSPRQWRQDRASKRMEPPVP
jgi:AraC-like DNA-binding protein